MSMILMCRETRLGWCLTLFGGLMCLNYSKHQIVILGAHRPPKKKKKCRRLEMQVQGQDRRI